jgi:hypothetical protein
VIERRRERVRSDERIRKRLRRMPNSVGTMHPTAESFGCAEAGACLVNPSGSAVLTKMLDENEFLSPYGIRALSRFTAAPVRLPWAARNTASATSGRIGYGDVPAALELARPDLMPVTCC